MTGETIATTALTTGNETYEARDEKLYLLSSSRLLAVHGRVNWTQGSDERSKRSALTRLGQSMGTHGLTVTARRESFRSCAFFVNYDHVTR